MNNNRIIKYLENYIPLNYQYSDINSLISSSQFNRFLRFLIDEENFRGYSAAYIGDLDIYYPIPKHNQIPLLFEREETVAKENKFCFNNILRSSSVIISLLLIGLIESVLDKLSVFPRYLLVICSCFKLRNETRLITCRKYCTCITT